MNDTRYTIKLKTLVCCFLMLAAGLPAVRAQLPDHDTSYYHTYRDWLTGRAYLSRKYTLLRFEPPAGRQRFVYNPNTSLNAGIGATYHAFTLNIGIGVSRFNPDEVRGRTRYLDLQAHFYARKWNVDLLGEFYRGYYLTPKGSAAPPGESYYKRNDLALNLAGLAFFRCLNDRRFSYQAGLLQNEWQQRSAGAFLAGGEIYYGAVHGDSVLSPSSLDPDYRQEGIDRLHFFEVGPSAGYAYTLVVRKHFFVLASVTLNLALRFTEELSSYNGKYAEKTDLTLNRIIHAGLGYNADKWNLSALWVSTRLNVSGPHSGYRYGIATGNYRLIYARRFSVNRKVRKMLQPIPDIIGK